jgi:hypothetical protein
LPKDSGIFNTFHNCEKIDKNVIDNLYPTAGFGWQKIVKSGKFWFLFSPDYFLVRSVQKLFKLKTREKGQKMDTQ